MRAWLEHGITWLEYKGKDTASGAMESYRGIINEARGLPVPVFVIIVGMVWILWLFKFRGGDLHFYRR